MSRIGKRSVAIPSGVTANIEGKTLSVKGPKGTLTMGLSDLIEYKLEDGEISVKPANETRAARNHWGMQRTMVSNLVEGVTEGFTKVLEINGVGYRAQAQGKKLKLRLGYSHDVDLDVPEGIERAARALLRETPGDILCFLPGEREIREAQDHLAKKMGEVEILPLYARLSPAEQPVENARRPP